MTKNQLRRKLLKKDSNMHDFALRYGFNPDTVRSAIDRYVGTKKQPRDNTVTHDVLQALSDEIGKAVAVGFKPNLKFSRLSKQERHYDENTNPFNHAVHL